MQLCIVAKLCAGAAFSDDGKKKPDYIRGIAHFYWVANDQVFSWHTSWGGGVDSNENSSNTNKAESVFTWHTR